MKFNELTTPDTLEQVKEIWSDLGIEYSLYQDSGTINLNRIVVPKEQRMLGIGTVAMKLLINYADKSKQKIALSPSSDFGGSKSRLIDFYKNLGFVLNKGRFKDFTTRETMIRLPLAENFADGKVKGKSRPGRVKKAGASCKGSVTDLRAKAKKYGGERGKMYHWCANMKGGKKKKTNEEEKYTSRSKEIRDKFKQAGYKLIGTGADATVWAKKDSDQVVKIIMPEDNLGSDKSNHFVKFYEFCNSHYDLANLPKFLKVKNLNIQGQNYISVYMEKLYPIPVNSFEEAMVWILSDLSTSAKKYKQAEAAILNKNTWIGFTGLDSKSIIEQYKKLNKVQIAQYSLLFSLMKLLYHSGRVDKLGWDLHTENVMQRKDGTLVIIDPWLNI